MTAYLIAIILAFTAYYYNLQYLLNSSDVIAHAFTTIIKWFAIPLVSLSILSTTSKLESKKELLTLGGNVFKYTILTTVIAASTGLTLFLLFHPHADISLTHPHPGITIGAGFGELLTAAVFITLIASVLLISNTSQTRYKIEAVIDWAYKKVMWAISKILLLMPIAVWAFMIQFLRDIDALTMKSLGIYIACVVGANLIQALIVLPALLAYKRISARKLFTSMLPAINVAFWAKSSSMALPVALQCAHKADISKKIANFSLPLCITINMNACAAFILTTVLFVTTSNGAHYSIIQYAGWVLVATIAAIGNAGVPMGCYTITGAILAFMGTPLFLLGLILPFYSFIDMLESAINVWSDSCVTKLVNEDVG